MEIKLLCLSILAAVLVLNHPIQAYRRDVRLDRGDKLINRPEISSSEEEKNNENYIRGSENLKTSRKTQNTFILSQGPGVPCGDFSWTAYKDEKCFKILPTLATADEAESLCRKASGDPSSPLLSIKSYEEQEFLKRFIFEERRISNNVWLAAKRVNGGYTFQWNADRADFQFTNWDSYAPSGDINRNCVQMSSRNFNNGQYPIGIDGPWNDVPCDRMNTVVCQKRQDLNPHNPDQDKIVEENRRRIIVLERDMGETKGNIKRLDGEISQTKGSISKLQQQGSTFAQRLDKLRNDLAKTDQAVGQAKQNSIPIGFIYVQYPNHQAPTAIWPGLGWADVTAQYAGMFFRAEGAGSAGFGSVQNADSPRITKLFAGGFNPALTLTSRDVPLDLYSSPLHTGGFDGQKWGVKMFTNDVENRPKNMAIRIWERTK